MTHFVAQLRREAEVEIDAMKRAALRARDAHARAELMRHMLMTADRVKTEPAASAVRFIVDHWLEAWHLDRGTWPHVADMETFAAAFHAYAGDPNDAHDAAVRAAADRIEKAFADAALPLAEQMAWRSVCAHGWWALVRPAPPGRGRTDREWPREAFWADGCPAHCL